jgi:hypothetical protein
MSHHRGVARDDAGNSISGASVTVYNAGTTTAATIYSEGTLTTTESNPFTTGDDGVYEFYADPGLYDIQVAKSGYNTTTLSNQTLGHVIAQVRMNTAATSVASTGTDQPLDTTFGTLDYTGNLLTGFSLDGTTERIIYEGEDTKWLLCSAQVSLDLSAAADFTLRLYHDDGSAQTVFAQAKGEVGGAEQISLFAQGAYEFDEDDELYVTVIVTSGNIDTLAVDITAIGVS